MSYNWEEIGKTVYGILSVGGYRPIQMWDADGTKTMDPAESVRFIATKKSNDPNLDSFDVMLVIHDENATSHLDIETPNLTDPKDFDITYSLKKNIQKNIGDKYGLTINWSKFSHNIKSKDADEVAIQESKDISRVYGTTKSSFQRVGESKLIIRHTDPIDESKRGSRWRKIKGIFIETKLGERFNYPHSHVAGARAMARHLSNNGSFVDHIAEAIKTMSSDYVNLKKANILFKKNGLLKESNLVKDSVNFINKNVKKLSGPRGYAKMLESIPSLNGVELTSEVENLANKLAEACNCFEGEDKEPMNVAAKHLLARKIEMRDRFQKHLNDTKARIEANLNNDNERVRKLLAHNPAAIKTGLTNPKIAASIKHSQDLIDKLTKEIEELGTQTMSESIKRLQVLGGVPS